MERESNPMQAPCRRGCGFYGSPNTDNLCSVCHKEALKKKNQQPPSTTSNSSVSSSGLSALANASTTALVSVPSRVMDTAIPTIPIISPVADSKIAELRKRKKSEGERKDSKGEKKKFKRTKREKLEEENELQSASSSAAKTSFDPVPALGAYPPNDRNLSEIDTACGSASSSVSGADDDKDGDRDSKKKKNRCATCRKKVGLTGFECRCGGMYCAVHRYSDKHECPFDYRLLGATEIRRNNPVVVGEKIKKI